MANVEIERANNENPEQKITAELKMGAKEIGAGNRRCHAKKRIRPPPIRPLRQIRSKKASDHRARPRLID